PLKNACVPMRWRACSAIGSGATRAPGRLPRLANEGPAAGGRRRRPPSPNGLWVVCTPQFSAGREPWLLLKCYGAFTQPFRLLRVDRPQTWTLARFPRGPRRLQRRDLDLD